MNHQHRFRERSTWSSRKFRESNIFIREEWPFPDKGILIKTHMRIYIYTYTITHTYIYNTHDDIYTHHSMYVYHCMYVYNYMCVYQHPLSTHH